MSCADYERTLFCPRCRAWLPWWAFYPGLRGGRHGYYCKPCWHQKSNDYKRRRTARQAILDGLGRE